MRVESPKRKKLDSLYIEGDIVVDRTDLTFENWIQQSILLLARRACESIKNGMTPFCAFPLTHYNWSQINSICEKQNVTPICITLAPRIEIALSKRRDRDLQDWEIIRIHEMYSEGFPTRDFSTHIIDNSEQTPEETVRVIQTLLWPQT